MKVAATFEFTVQRASEEESDKFNMPLGIIEVIDPDGDRYAFVKTEQEAFDAIQKLCDDIGLGTCDVAETN